MTDWTTKEAAKVRRKVEAWATAACRVNGPALGARTAFKTLNLYAESIGVDTETARARMDAQAAHLAAMEAESDAKPRRRYTDARPRPGGPDWTQKHAATIRRRCRALADRVCYFQGDSDNFLHNWPSSWKPIQGV